MTSLLFLLSRFPVGSSARIIAGFAASALPMAARCSALRKTGWEGDVFYPSDPRYQVIHLCNLGPALIVQ